jgi:amino acid transporter
VATIEQSLSVTSVEKRKMRREVGLVALLFTSVGSIIGSGWLLGALNASVIAGPGALVSWLIGAVAVLLLALVHAELGGMYPVTGGSARFPHYSFGSLVGFASGWFAFLGAVTVAPIEVEAALQYATNYIPGLTELSGNVVVLTGLGYGVAVLLMLAFVIINILGVKWLAEANKYAVYWKIAIPVLTVIVLLIVSHHFGNFTARGGFFANGLPAVFSAVATGGIIFAYIGFEQAVQFGAESQNPRRNIPLAVIGSVILGVILYLALQVAFTTSLDPKVLNQGWSHIASSFQGAAFGPFAALATALGLGWLAVLLYVDAVVSPAGTGLIYLGSSTRLAFGMARNRYLPEGLAFLSDRRVPLFSILFAFVCGMLLFLPFPSWQRLVGFITSATLLTYGLQSIALAALRKQVPDQERPFRLPWAGVIAPLSFVIANELILFSTWDVLWKLLLAIVVGFVLLAVSALTAAPARRPKLELMNAYWLGPYLIGLGAISYLGSKSFGGSDRLHFGWDMLVLAIFSLAIYFLAVALRLKDHQAREYIFMLGAESEAEEEEVALAEPTA